MRNAVVGALFVFLPPSAFAAPPAVPADAVVMPDTPSGQGDPDTVVCRAPQPMEGTDQLGPKVCGTNREWSLYRTHGIDLAPDGMTIVDKPMVSNPTGKGNPDAVTCRKPKPLQGPGRNLGPEVCLTNQAWAELIKNRLMITADAVIVPEPRWRPSMESTTHDDPLQGYRAP